MVGSKDHDCYAMRTGVRPARMVAIAGALGLVLAATSLLPEANTQGAEPPPQPAGFAKCAECHETTPDAPPATGPNLLGVVGRKAGTASDFDYSDAMKASGIIWTAGTLTAYITSPAKVVPNGAMDYPGQPDPVLTASIVAYLLSLKK